MNEPALPRAFGPYVLLERLGRGGYGDVYYCMPAGSDGRSAPIVLKRLRTRALENELAVKRFRHEATVAMSIDTPYVARVLGAGTIAGEPFITMRYVPGWPLARVRSMFSKLKAPFEIELVASLIGGVLRGLELLHNAVHPETKEPLGLVHRDISLKNLILDPAGRLTIIDLGLGKSNVKDWATTAGALLGTPGYISPELIAGEAVDRRADLYGLGVVCFELLTLERYSPREGEEKNNRRVGTFRPPSSLRPDIPEAIDVILERALAHKPEDRFESAAMMLRALENVFGPAVMRDPKPSELPRAYLEKINADRAALEKLARAHADAELEPGNEPTEIFAGCTELAYGPVRVRPVIVPITAPEGARFVQVNAAEHALGEVSESTEGPADKTASVEAPAPAAAKVRVRHGPPKAATAAIAFSILALGGAAMFGSSRDDAAMPPPPPPAEKPASIVQRPAIQARPNEPEPDPAPQPEEQAEPTPDSDPPPANKPKHAGPRPAKKAESPAPQTAPAPAAAPARSFDTLIKRAALAKRDHPNEASAIDELIADATLWIRASDSPKAKAELDRLERKLDAILRGNPK